MSEDKAEYRQIIKATSILGGVQVIGIITGLFRSKFIAVLLGPAGMGLSGLLQSGTGMIASLTSFGLSTSAIKNISVAQNESDDEKLGRVIAVFRKLVWVTGLIGMIITLSLSSYLSQITFGNCDYTWSFALLSVTLLINQLSAGQGVMLRAMRKIKLMAKASVLGSIVGLIITYPLYFVYGQDGIVPALITAAVIPFILNWYFSSKLPFKKVKVDFSIVKMEGKEMLVMGFMISVSGLITMMYSYLVRIFIRNYGSIDDVGLYTAGFAIVNTYVGMIFTAMATDYYPKLSASAHDVHKTNETINKQAEIAILIISPLLLFFIIFIKLVVYFLYTDAFLPVNNMILFAAGGMLFKTLSWAIAFLFLAKSESRLFFWNEVIANTYTFGLNIFGYYYYGLTGLGMSFMISYVLYSIQVYFISKCIFGFALDRDLTRILFVNLVLTMCCLVITLLINNTFVVYAVGCVLIVISIVYNFIILDKQLGILGMLKKKCGFK